MRHVVASLFMVTLLAGLILLLMKNNTLKTVIPKPLPNCSKLVNGAVNTYSDIAPLTAQATFHAALFHTHSPVASSVSRARLCADLSLYSSDFEMLCTNTSTPSWPYCCALDLPVHIVEVHCAYIESFIGDPNTLWNILIDGYFVAVNMYSPIMTTMPPVHSQYDVIGTVGSVVFPNAPGHFFNEILPALLHLDKILEPAVPLLWPAGLGERILNEFTQARLLSNRTYIVDKSPIIFVRRLLLYNTNLGTRQRPYLVAQSQRLLASVVHSYVGPKNRTRIVLLSRRGARSLANEAELVKALGPVDVFEPNGPFLETAQRVAHAHTIVGPHGANLNNMFGAAENTLVLEIVYRGGMRHPSDYLCLARNLGLRYALSVATAGGYYDLLTADIDDVVATINGIADY